MDLADYMKETGETEAQLAARIGCAQATVNRLKRKTGKASAALMARVHEVTGGKVTANDLLGLANADSEAA